MNRFFTFTLLVFLTCSLQVQLSAIHGSEEARVQVVQNPHASLVQASDEGIQSIVLGPQEGDRKTFKSKLNTIVNKVVHSVTKKNKPPKRVRERGAGMAVAALILGILGILTVPYLLLSILALILGSISMKRYNEGYHDRRGMAKAGVILGIIGIGLSVLALGLLFSFLLV